MGLKENIKKYRNMRNMTLEEVAKIVGVSRQTVQKYESGLVSNIPPDKIERLALALKVSPPILMGWDDEKEPELVMVRIKKCELPVYELDTSGDGSLVYKGVEVFIMEEDFEFKEGAFAVKIIENELQPRMLDGDAILVEKMTFDDWREHKGKLVIVEYQSLKIARIVEFQNGEPVLVSITGFEKNLGISEITEYLGVATNLIRRKLY